MTAVVLDGRVIAQSVRERTATGVAEFVERYGYRPGLATILVGADPASAVYVRNKRRSAEECGIADLHRHLDASASAEEIAATIDGLAADDAVSGILLQLPLPNGQSSVEFVDRIPAVKDVDGLTTLSQGLLARGMPSLRPCTPSGVIEILDYAAIPIRGTRAVVIGRSELVGRPMAALLLQRDATVTIAHSRTQDLAALTREADIVIAAAGIPHLIGAGYVREGAAIIDVGIHRTDNGLIGDVDTAAVSSVAGFVTPVPGGVGPMTIAMLLQNTLAAAELQALARQ